MDASGPVGTSLIQLLMQTLLQGVTPSLLQDLFHRYSVHLTVI